VRVKPDRNKFQIQILPSGLREKDLNIDRLSVSPDVTLNAVVPDSVDEGGVGRHIYLDLPKTDLRS